MGSSPDRSVRRSAAPACRASPSSTSICASGTRTSSVRPASAVVSWKSKNEQHADSRAIRSRVVVATSSRGSSSSRSQVGDGRSTRRSAVANSAANSASRRGCCGVGNVHASPSAHCGTDPGSSDGRTAAAVAISARTAPSGCAPTSVPTVLRSAIRTRVGVEDTRYRRTSSGFSSALTCTTGTRPAYSAATLASVGANRRQFPHQVVKNSTSTGASVPSTSRSNRSSLVCPSALVVVSCTALASREGPSADPSTHAKPVPGYRMQVARQASRSSLGPAHREKDQRPLGGGPDGVSARVPVDRGRWAMTAAVAASVWRGRRPPFPGARRGSGSPRRRR